MPKTSKQKCFVVMPFSQTTKEHTKNYWDDHYQKFLKPLIELESGFVAERSKALRGDIIRQIIADLVMAPIAVADLTDSNANVYWELGVRQSFRYGTITIAEHGVKLASDVAAKGTLYYYPKDYIANEEFRKDFDTAIRDCISNPDRPDSQVLETISGRGTIYKVLSREETIRKLEALASEAERNRDLANNIERTVKKNSEARKEGKRVTFPTGRFRCPSVELLVVSRYVDAKGSFYNWAELCFDELQKFNDQLSFWEGAQLSTEAYLRKNIQLFLNNLAEFKTLVEEHINNTRESI